MTHLPGAHTFLWWSSNNPALSRTAKDILQSPQNRLVVSTASIWELSLKCGLGKLPDFEPFQDSATLERFLNAQTIELLPISLNDISSAAKLPLHHKDPFDRIIIAQAQQRHLNIITKDEMFKHYAVQVIW